MHLAVFKQREIDGLVLSLDAEKAFDHIEYFLFWKIFILVTLSSDELECYMKNLKLLLLLTVLGQQVFFYFLLLYRGTRQGCPLSPLLFVLAIEPLAEAIRAEPSIEGLQSDEKHHKLDQIYILGYFCEPCI